MNSYIRKLYIDIYSSTHIFIVDCGSSSNPIRVGYGYTGSSGFITSPNYPNNYYSNARCAWRIYAPFDSVN